MRGDEGAFNQDLNPRETPNDSIQTARIARTAGAWALGLWISFVVWALASDIIRYCVSFTNSSNMPA
jgi:hypothetical protein